MYSGQLAFAEESTDIAAVLQGAQCLRITKAVSFIMENYVRDDGTLSDVKLTTPKTIQGILQEYVYV